MTLWIMIWISLARIGVPTLSSLASSLAGGGAVAAPSLPTLATLGASVAGAPAALKAAFAGFTLPVWVVVFLKATNGILIPLTFK